LFNETLVEAAGEGEAGQAVRSLAVSDRKAAGSPICILEYASPAKVPSTIADH
jgi:hypothetical protein